VKEGKNTYSVLYIIVIIIMTIVYFSVPERKAFLENQMHWWGEMWDVVADGNLGEVDLPAGQPGSNRGPGGEEKGN